MDGLGSTAVKAAALGGLRAWALQRATALVALVFLLYFVLHLVIATPASQAEWRAWVLSRPMQLALALFFGAVALHAWVGMRDVILDYVKPLGLRLTALLLLALWLVVSVGWAIATLFPAG